MTQTAWLIDVISTKGADETIVPGVRTEWGPASEDSTRGAQKMRAQFTGSKELAKWLRSLEKLSTLVDGWNGQGAPAPSPKAIHFAQQLIEALVNDGQPPTRVAASALGGVGITRQAGSRRTYIEFYNDGTACALFSDDLQDENERVIGVPSQESGGFEQLLSSMKAYLNA
jgi:hypothetical protein